MTSTKRGRKKKQPVQNQRIAQALPHLTFPICPDPGQTSLAAFRNYSLPSSYAIDRGRQIRLVWGGVITRAGLEKYINPILEEEARYGN